MSDFDNVRPEDILKEYRKLQGIRKGRVDYSLVLLVLVVVSALIAAASSNPWAFGATLVFGVLYIIVRARGPKHENHKDQYLKLQRLVQRNQDALFSLVFSGKLNAYELHELIWFGGDGGSCKLEYNKHWAPFIARVRQRQYQLPEIIQSSLNWYLQVHGW